jgi:TatD DNase family protein
MPEECEHYPLIDGHAHLEEVEDLPRALGEAREASVRGIIAVGMDLASNRKTLEIAGQHGGYVYPALGYHPWEIREPEIEETLAFVKVHISEAVALGEIGLDYKSRVPKKLQWNVFGALLDVAVDFEKPVILHCRFSHQRALEMVRQRSLKKAVFHWFSAGSDLLDSILSSGYLISATPALTYSPLHQEAIRYTPLERILLETDCPVNYLGLDSRPKDVTISLREVARLKGLDLRVVAEQTTRNASEFFGIQF